MSGHFANSMVGFAGLFLFLMLFIGIMIWVFRPNSKAKFEELGDIPLKDE